jgi:hypothetical protein
MFWRFVRDSRFKQPTCKTTKLRRPCFRKGAGSAGISIPSLTRGCSLTNVRGAERRKARGNILTPCGVRPMTLGVRLAALHCGVFLRPRDRLLETDRGPLYGKPLIPRAFTRVHPPPPARCRTDPRSWAGQCLPRPPEDRLTRPIPQAPSPFHHLDASRWRPHQNEP